MARHSSSFHTQYGAVPFTVDRVGRIRVALISSRETQRWIIPKGWPIRKVSAAAVAVQETLEEAGLAGAVLSHHPAGHYFYAKLLPRKQIVTCRVTVFYLRVHQELRVWPEREERSRAWFSPDVAAMLLGEKSLAEIVRQLPAVLGSQNIE